MILGIGLLLELEYVEQFVLYIGKVITDDLGGLLVGDDLAQVEVVKQGPQDPAVEGQGADAQERKEHDFPDTCIEVKLIFKESYPEEENENHRNAVKRTPDDLIDIVFADKLVQFLNQQSVIIRTTHNNSMD